MRSPPILTLLPRHRDDGISIPPFGISNPRQRVWHVRQGAAYVPLRSWAADRFSRLRATLRRFALRVMDVVQALLFLAGVAAAGVLAGMAIRVGGV